MHFFVCVAVDYLYGWQGTQKRSVMRQGMFDFSYCARNYAAKKIFPFLPWEKTHFLFSKGNV